MKTSLKTFSVSLIVLPAGGGRTLAEVAFVAAVGREAEVVAVVLAALGSDSEAMLAVGVAVALVFTG